MVNNKWQNGLPYVGNKRSKVKDILATLPSGDRLIDTFGGGGCVSLHALDSAKYNSVVYNDKRRDIVDLLKTLIEDRPHIDLTKYVTINRKDFLNFRDNRQGSLERAIILLCFSFGNNQKAYLFGRKIEKERLLLTNALFHGNTGTDLDNMYLKSKDIKTIQEKYKFYHEYCYNILLKKPKRLQQLEQLQQLERLQQVRGGVDLNYSCRDYADLNIRKDDIVYCDPPYKNTGYTYDGFDEQRFVDWYSHSCPSKNIFISEYHKLPNTIIVSNLGKKNTFMSNTKRKEELLLKVIKGGN